MCILWQLAFSIFLRFILVDKTAVPHSFPLLPSISQFIYSPPYWQVLELSLLFHSGWCYEHFWHSFLVYRRKFVKDISEMELVDCWVTVRLLNRIKFELEDNFKPFPMHLHNLYIYIYTPSQSMSSHCSRSAGKSETTTTAQILRVSV